MYTISEYMKLPLQDRQRHLDTTTGCVERGGNSTHHKGVLSEFLNTEIASSGVDLSHYCGNSKYSNPRHLYWGAF